MSNLASIQIGPHVFRMGDRVRMLVDGMGCDAEDNERYYYVGDTATIVQLERYAGKQGLGVGVEFDNGIFNMFDAADEPPQYPFVPID